MITDDFVGFVSFDDDIVTAGEFDDEERVTKKFNKKYLDSTRIPKTRAMKMTSKWIQ